MEIPFFHSNFSSLGAVLGVGLGLLLGSGCVAQQADLAKIQKDLEMQISKIKEEKRALGAQVDEAKSAISESQALISQQKADMAKMRSDLAPLNQQVKLLREQDLTSLYGKNEVAEKRIGDLEKSLKNLTDSLESLKNTVASQGGQLQDTQTQTTTLVQQVDESNQALTNTMTE